MCYRRGLSTQGTPKSPLDALPERGSEPTPLVPDAATWQAMTPAEREAAMWAVIDGMPLSETMSEGMRHMDAKMAVVERLRRDYRHGRQPVLIAAGLVVMYPAERSFVPDILAVRDVELHDRDAWILMEEGRGPDLVLEIRNKGRRAKDYVRNVERFARLGIQEYFVSTVGGRRSQGTGSPGRAPPATSPSSPNAGDIAATCSTSSSVSPRAPCGSSMPPSRSGTPTPS